MMPRWMAVHVIPNRVAADSQSAANFLVGEPAGQHLQNFQFARCKICAHQAFGESRCDVAGEVTPARVNSVNGLHHVGLRGSFQKISLCAGLHRTMDIFVGLKAGQDDRADMNVIRLEAYNQGAYCGAGSGAGSGNFFR